MINPFNHGKTAEGIVIYKVEPYVLAANVYSSEPQAGRGERPDTPVLQAGYIV